MSETLKPATADQVVDAVAQALAAGTPLEVVGQGSKRAIGRPMEAESRLDLSKLTGISLYEPAELVLRAAAGTPRAEIEAALAAERQRLAFDPPDLGALLGGPAGRGTLAGMVVPNLGGPRRLSAGAPRDHLLGYKAVSGRAEAYKAGGRVMKNVTGFDLCKLMAGSWGTLGVLTELTLKVQPLPETSRTVLLLGLTDGLGVRALSRAMGGPHEVAAAAHLPAGVAALSKVAAVARAGAEGRAVTALKVEGPGPSVAHRAGGLKTDLADLSADAEDIHDAQGATLWQEIRDATLLAEPAEGLIWRLSVTPMRGPEIAHAIVQRLPGTRGLYDWAGGLVWLAVPGDTAQGDGGAGPIRRALAEHGGGHALLLRGPEALRARVAVFQPEDRVTAALSRRLRLGFDPRLILNRGRLIAEQPEE
ncbi:FAD-binding protein [Roseospirillum parvum]|uniref:Glycolate oxidase FAD binding subunit n=1 Tax=Roseospirillum parvum TaxID=83401 RepID=A0A1G7YCY5_9PROT|nr:FAD-binding protein [Roseospirillum parvum]SDG94197.1 glycolate oxidase FAD binding subunit [Roseospirillum parvum]